MNVTLRSDPGAGTLLWQMAIAALSGAGFYRRRIASWFQRRKGPKD